MTTPIPSKFDQILMLEAIKMAKAIAGIIYHDYPLPKALKALEK